MQDTGTASPSPGGRGALESLANRRDTGTPGHLDSSPLQSSQNQELAQTASCSQVQLNSDFQETVQSYCSLAMPHHQVRARCLAEGPASCWAALSVLFPMSSRSVTSAGAWFSLATPAPQTRRFRWCLRLRAGPWGTGTACLGPSRALEDTSE